MNIRPKQFLIAAIVLLSIVAGHAQQRVKEKAVGPFGFVPGMTRQELISQVGKAAIVKEREDVLGNAGFAALNHGGGESDFHLFRFLFHAARSCRRKSSMRARRRTFCTGGCKPVKVR